MLLVFVLLFSIGAVIGENSEPPKCPENPTICMLSLLNSWETLRLAEKNATSVLLPVVYYSKSSLISLCKSYTSVAETCGFGRCHLENPVADFVLRHFSFVCDERAASRVFDNQQCVSSTLVTSGCTEKIREEPKIGGDLFCPRLDEFVTCVEEPLRTSCGNEAYALVMKTVEKYGCPGNIEISKVNEFLSLGVDSAVVEVEQKLEVTSENPIVEVEISEATEEVTTTTTTSTTPSEILMESSGEMPEEVTTTTEQTTVATRKPKKKHFDAENMTDCFNSIVGDFGRFLHSSPTASFVRFPLFGIKPMELEVLCAKYDVATECVASFCIGNCRLPPIKSFVDSQLKETCLMRDSADFELEFTCLQNVLKESTECISFLNSTNPNKCDGHPQFRSCIVDKLIGECSEDTVQMMDRLQNGYGCKMLVEQDEPEVEASGEALEGSGSGEVPEELKEHKEFEEKEQKSNQTSEDSEKLLTEEKPETCEGSVKTAALSCLAPLLRLWTGIKENRKDTEVVFPIFEFSKIELLELCDSFANYRNCIKYTNSGICRSDSVINFAEQHFGQVCTTQQIEASMRTHDCIHAINPKDLAQCQRFSKGETMPGKRKCQKVRRYTKCLRQLVATSCGNLMLAQFDMIVHRFGC